MYIITRPNNQYLTNNSGSHAITSTLKLLFDFFKLNTY